MTIGCEFSQRLTPGERADDWGGGFDAGVLIEPFPGTRRGLGTGPQAGTKYL